MANLDKAAFFKFEKFTKASKLSKLLSKLLLKLLTSAVLAVYLISYCLEQVAFLGGIELAPHWSVGRADVLLESVRISGRTREDLKDAFHDLSPSERNLNLFITNICILKHFNSIITSLFVSSSIQIVSHRHTPNDRYFSPSTADDGLKSPLQSKFLKRNKRKFWSTLTQ